MVNMPCILSLLHSTVCSTLKDKITFNTIYYKKISENSPFFEEQNEFKLGVAFEFNFVHFQSIGLTSAASIEKNNINILGTF